MKGHSMEKKTRLNKDGSVCKKGTGQKTCTCGQKAPVRKKQCSACGKDTVWLLKRDKKKKRKKTGQPTKGGHKKKKLKVEDSDPFLVDGVSSVHSQVTETCSFESFSCNKTIDELKEDLKAKKRALANKKARFKKNKKAFITKANDLKRRRNFVKKRKKLVIAEKKAIIKREAKIRTKEDQLVSREAKLKAKEEEMVQREAKIRAKEDQLVSREAKLKAKEEDMVDELKANQMDIDKWTFIFPESTDYTFHNDMDLEYDCIQDTNYDGEIEEFILSSEC